MRNEVCVICHQYNDKENKLKQISQLVRRYNIAPTKTDNVRFNWGHNIRCKFGLPCSKTDRINQQNNRIATELEPYLISVAKSDDEQSLHELLQLLRGNYPSVYKIIENLHYIHKKENDNDNKSN